MNFKKTIKKFFPVIVFILVVWFYFAYFVTSWKTPSEIYHARESGDNNTFSDIYIKFDSSNDSNPIMTEYIFNNIDGAKDNTMPMYFIKIDYPFKMYKWNYIIPPVCYDPRIGRYGIAFIGTQKYTILSGDGKAVGYDNFYNKIDLSKYDLSKKMEDIQIYNNKLKIDSIEMNKIGKIPDKYTKLFLE